MRLKPYTFTSTFLLLCSLVVLSPTLFAQGGGGFGGGGSGASSSMTNSNAFQFDANRGNITNGISLHGSAIIRLKPEKVRIVLAMISEAEKPEDCHAINLAAVKKVRDEWRKMGISDETVIEDFIAMLPRYDWSFERRMAKATNVDEEMKQDEELRSELQPDFFKLAVLEQIGHRIQSNLHLETDSEASAMEAINVAFRHGVKDVIAFDYWSSKTDEARKEAMKKALEEAKTKAETLLSVFEKKPSVVHISEHTEVVQPASQYETFTNILDQQYRNSNWSGYQSITSTDPKQSFYRGVIANTDLQANGLPMVPSIMVVSKVTIQYRTPGQKRVTLQE